MNRPPHADNGFRPDIQGLRAVAVLAVVIYHAGVWLVPGGYSGVDVFFVISGFLITSHLLSVLRDHGTIRFSDFYARRIRRILPAALTVLVLTALASVMFVPRVETPGTLEDAAATALYLPNLLFAVQGTDYLAETSPSPFQHYWSLGIEEQFYLLWPAVLLGAYLLVRRSNRRLAAVIAALVATSFASGLILLEVSPPWAFFSLPSRAWELGVGALAALVLRHAAGRLPTAVGRVLMWSGLAGMLAGFVLLTSSTPFPGIAALLPTLSTAAVILGGSAGAHPGLLTNRPMQAMGKWSYSLYLVHWPLLTIPQLAVGVEHPLPLAGTLALGALSIPLAVLLHHYVEEPFRRRSRPTRGHTGRTLPALAMATAGALVIAGSAYGAGLYIDRTPATAAQPAERKAGLPYPEGTPFVPSNVTPVLERAATSAPPTNGDGCHAPVKQTEPQTHCIYGDPDATQDVVLFGDSHAEQWFAGVDRLARENSLRLRTLTKASCPAVSISIERQGSPYTECDQWREHTLQTIRDLKPRLVVLGNYGRVTPVSDSADLREQWEEGLRATINALPEETEVVVMADTPFHNSAPASCLSRNIDDAAACDAEPEEALNAPRAAVERKVAEETGARFLDMNKYLCGEQCPAIIGDILAYRDAHHLSEPMGEALAPRVAAELDKEL
ncbi:acyltransferase family protein [Arthrobacter tecti]